MKEIDTRSFHDLFGVKRTRITFQKKDFLDYTIMTLICASIIYYSVDDLLAKIGIVLCLFMIISFPIRHGIEFQIPLILRRPQDILYMLVYKIQMMKLPYLFAIVLVLSENYLIFLTPQLPHQIDLMREIAIFLFFFHFIFISIYRTIILISHLNKRNLVKEVLMQSSWKSFIAKQPSISFEIFHAYFTGILTHLILIIPWYVIVTHVNFSILFTPVICILNLFTLKEFMKVNNYWFYRNHWLGHNSEMDFLYLHGTHHDVIPSGLIGAAENGHLEGLIRDAIGAPTPYYNPIFSFFIYTKTIFLNINDHQYIPGIFPKIKGHTLHQHSVHHYGLLQPYGLGVKVDRPDVPGHIKEWFDKNRPEEYKNSVKLDELLGGFKWDNARFRWYLALVDKYQKE